MATSVVMREVSCRAFIGLCAAFRKQRLDTRILVQDVDLPLEYLRNRRERMSWQTWCMISRNASTVWHPEDFEAFGRSVLESPVIRSVGYVAGALFTVRELYSWVNQSGSGPGNQLFTCVNPQTIDVGPNHLRVTLTMEPGYDASPEFFLTSKGSLEALPRFVGLPPARVTMTLADRGAEYDVHYPTGGGALAGVRRLVSRPFAARRLALENKEAHEALLERYRDLDAARAELDQQATQLRTAFTISHALRQDLDLDRTLSAVVTALVEVAEFTTARIEVSSQAGSWTAWAGARCFSKPTVIRTIEARGQSVGTLSLWPAADANLLEREELLDQVLPTVCLAVADALSYAAVVDYRDHLEERVEERTRELREAQAVRERIFANINHEIRTPLSLITMATAALRDGVATGDRATSAKLEEIDRASTRLLDLVEELLLLAAGQEGRLSVDVKSQDVAQLLSSLVRSWTTAASDTGITLTYSGPHHCAAEVDERGFLRIVTNLITNAIKYTPSGGKIDVVLSAAPDQIRVVVADTGVGVPENVRDTVFERFERAGPPVHAGWGGSGLGLSIVREVAEAHGGKAGILPTTDGSSFFVTLPRKGEGSSCSDGWGTTREPLDATYGSPPSSVAEVNEPVGAAEATVLVAEDDQAMLQALVGLLTRTFRVLAAPDGAAALDLAQVHHPDVLVTDRAMPKMDGIELIKRFRELPGNRLAPVILLTAYADAAHKLGGFEAGALDYVTKPFAPDELVARIRAQLTIRDRALRLHETEKLSALGVLTAGLAHELGNPANVVANAIVPLRKRLPASLLAGDDSIAELLDVAEACAERISHLSRELLGLAPSRPPDCTVQPIREVVDAAVRAASDILEDVPFSMDLRFDGSTYCCRPLVVQILVNLLKNAAEAVSNGGQISLLVHRMGDWVCVDVANPGPPIPPKVRDKIFTPFFSTKRPGRGVGLGLAISRILAERQGGSLSLLPDGQRTVFRLELCASPPQPPA